MRILITGSRHWADRRAIASAIHEQIGDTDPTTHTLIHGGALGADMLGNLVAKNIGMNIETYPADWGTLGRAAGPIRNRQMVESGADVCLAFPVGASPGTRGCMRMAAEAGVTIINYGDGENSNV